MKKIITSLAILTLILSNSAYAQHNHNHDHGATKEEAPKHAHSIEELPMVMLTSVKDGYEAYLGIRTQVEGSDTHFHLHLTDLSNYKAVTGAKATVKIGEFSTKESVSKNGLFHFGIKVSKHGEMPISANVEVNGKQITFDMGKLTVFHSLEEAAHAPAKAHAEGLINLSKDWMWNHDFGVEIVSKGKFNEVIRTRGEILPSTQSQAVIVAPTSGQISYVSNIVAGRQIEKGQTIGYIKSSNLENNIKSRFNKLKANWETAKSNYERDLELSKSLIVSKKQLAESHNSMVQAEEAYKSLEKIYSDKGVRVVAQSRAIISQVLVQENNFINEGEAIANIQLKKENMLKVEISKFNASKISHIKDANFIPEYSDETLRVSSLGGTKLIGNISTQQNSAYIPIYFSLPVNEKVIPYSYSEVFVELSYGEEVMSLPLSAICENEGAYWVYVQHSGEEFEKRDIKVGGSNGERRIVLSGIKVGDIVVTVGSSKIRQSEGGTAIPHGHSH